MQNPKFFETRRMILVFRKKFNAIQTDYGLKYSNASKRFIRRNIWKSMLRGRLDGFRKKFHRHVHLHSNKTARLSELAKRSKHGHTQSLTKGVLWETPILKRHEASVKCIKKAPSRFRRLTLYRQDWFKNADPQRYPALKVAEHSICGSSRLFRWYAKCFVILRNRFWADLLIHRNACYGKTPP